MIGGQWSSSFGLRLSGKNLASGNIAPVRANVARSAAQTLGFGTGTSEINQLVLMERSLGAGGSETLDLYDGSTCVPALIDLLGANIAIRTLRSAAFWIVDGGDTAGVTIGNAASNAHTLWMGGTTPTATIYPDSGPFSGGQQAGTLVTSSARNVKVTNNGVVSVTYMVALAGSVTVSGGAMGGLLLSLTYP